MAGQGTKRLNRKAIEHMGKAFAQSRLHDVRGFVLLFGVHTVMAVQLVKVLQTDPAKKSRKLNKETLNPRPCQERLYLHLWSKYSLASS
jgi:hypothetical protein